MLACEFGITTQAIVNNLTPILLVIFKDSFGISYTLIANLLLINFAAQLITDALSIKIIHTFGYRKSGIIAQLCAASGLIFLGLLPHFLPVYPALLFSVVTYAFGGGLLEVMVSPIVDSLDIGHRSARMSMLHSFYCWGQLAVVLISTAAIKIFSGRIWWILPLCWSVIPIINSWLFKIVPIPEIADGETIKTPRSLLKMPVFITMSVLMLCSGAAETTMSQWASLFAQKGLGINKFLGDLLGPCMFAAFMGIGRMLYGIFGGRLNLKKSLIVCSTLCILCYITAAVSQNPYIALLGCSLIGLSVSIMWPGVYSFSSRMIPGGSTAMFSILALSGDIGCSLGSWLCGIISELSLKSTHMLLYAQKLSISPEQIGLKIGIGSTALFPLIMLVLLIFTKNPEIE